jgi:hypothetical protein
LGNGLLAMGTSSELSVVDEASANEKTRLAKCPLHIGGIHGKFGPELELGTKVEPFPDDYVHAQLIAFLFPSHRQMAIQSITGAHSESATSTVNGARHDKRKTCG